MSFIEKTRSILDDLGITNASKVYTPFTAFCIFFAIYFNAETLGIIFLSPDDAWPDQLEALKSLKNKDWTQWMLFLGTVSSYSICAVIIYGSFQAISAGVWSLSNAASINASRYSDKKSYMHINEYSATIQDLKEQLDSTRKNYFSPNVVTDLENKLKEKTDSLENEINEKSQLIKKRNYLIGTSNFYQGLAKFHSSNHKHSAITDVECIRSLEIMNALSEIAFSNSEFISFNNENISVEHAVAFAFLSQFKLTKVVNDEMGKGFTIEFTVPIDTRNALKQTLSITI